MVQANKGKKNLRQLKTTVLLVGEGRDEFAFLKYLHGLANVRGGGTMFTIKQAGGGSVGNVLKYACRQQSLAEYEKTCVLVDNDRPADWTDDVFATAKRHGIKIFKAEPDLETMLLGVLDILPRSEDRKAQLDGLCGRDRSDPQRFKTLFTLECLQSAGNRIDTIRELLELFDFAPAA